MKKIFVLVAIGLVVALGIIGSRATETYADGNPLDKENCLSCHGKPDFKTVKKGQSVSIYVDPQTVSNSAHRYIDCTTCHSSSPHKISTPLTKESLADKCGTCHQYQRELHEVSVHGRQLALGNPDVATCVDCHSTDGLPHSVKRVLSYESPAYRKNIAETCAQCHGDERLMARYGIVEKVYESYMRSFHGKATKLGTFEITQLDKATCTNCHGTHDIMSPSDPGSPVGTVSNLSNTCESCHTGAGENFARSFIGHKEASPQYFPMVFFAERFFFWLTASVVAFGVFLVSMEILHWAIRSRRREVQ